MTPHATGSTSTPGAPRTTSADSGVDAGHRRHPWQCAWLLGAGSTEAAGSRAVGHAVGPTSGGAVARRLTLIAEYIAR